MMDARLIGASRGRTIPRDFLSVHINNLAHDYPPVVGPIVQTPYYDFGQGYVRVIDNRCTPKFIAPNSGSYNWTTMDQTIATIRAAGAKVLYVLGNLPDWMTGQTTTPGSAYSAFPPINIADMVAVYGAIATRYAGQIDSFQIWNEPNLTRYWQGTDQQLADIAAASYTALKAVSPSVPIVGPSFVSLPGLGMMDRFLRLGGGAYMDIVAINGYVDPAQPELIADRAMWARGLAASHGLGDRDLWISEVGYTTYYDGSSALIDIAGPVMSDDQAASYTLRTLIAAWIAGASHVGHYAADTDVAKSRLLKSDLVTPSGAGEALEFFADTLVGGTLSAFRQVADVGGSPHYRAAFTAGDGRRGHLVWAQDGTTATADFSAVSSIFDARGRALSPVSAFEIKSLPSYVFA